MASKSITKVLVAHTTARGKRADALAAFFGERRPTGKSVVQQAFQDPPSDLRIFFLVLAIINALADVIAGDAPGSLADIAAFRAGSSVAVEACSASATTVGP